MKQLEANQLKFQFFEWLSAHNALTSYIANFCTFYNTDVAQFNDKLYKYDPIYWIDRAFTWMDTPQGHDYWEDLEYEWKKVIWTINRLPQISIY